MSKSYDFVPFLECKPYNSQDKNYDGVIPIKIRTLTPIHLSFGEYSIDKQNRIFKPFTRINDSLVIPGSSIKGVIRSIAEAISYSCYTPSGQLDRERLPDKRHPNRDSNCIICHMFGTMSHKSKVYFSDSYIREGTSQIIGLPASFPPRPTSLSYHDEEGKYKGHKFYKHGILGIQARGDILYEYVLEDSEFQGQVRFNGLTDEQVQLLCFSLGLSGDIQPKIGFGKGHYYGSISIESEGKWIDKAKEYKEIKNADISGNIAKIIEILNFNNAVKSLE